ncbi:hypothetical protein KSP39_PZI016469 [Platanthera zijinensis]|uniref:Uncharacterized protein n=1 Tax=Platanthera zijinensis TaxID=2320716 RepID=A0AAP0G0N2_9ASPA
MSCSFILLTITTILLVVVPSHTAISFPQIPTSELIRTYCNVTDNSNVFTPDDIPLHSSDPIDLLSNTLYCKASTISEETKNISSMRGATAKSSLDIAHALRGDHASLAKLEATLTANSARFLADLAQLFGYPLSPNSPPSSLQGSAVNLSMQPPPPPPPPLEQSRPPPSTFVAIIPQLLAPATAPPLRPVITLSAPQAALPPPLQTSALQPPDTSSFLSPPAPAMPIPPTLAPPTPRDPFLPPHVGPLTSVWLLLSSPPAGQMMTLHLTPVLLMASPVFADATATATRYCALLWREIKIPADPVTRMVHELGDKLVLNDRCSVTGPPLLNEFLQKLFRNEKLCEFLLIPPINKGKEMLIERVRPSDVMLSEANHEVEMINGSVGLGSLKQCKSQTIKRGIFLAQNGEIFLAHEWKILSFGKRIKRGISLAQNGEIPASL